MTKYSVAFQTVNHRLWSNFNPLKTNTEYVIFTILEQTRPCPYSQQVNWQNNIADQKLTVLFQVDLLKKYIKYFFSKKIINSLNFQE
jgi:hypothetical protein